MKKFAKFICKNKTLIIIISGILLILSVIGMNLTKINYDILVYLPDNIETIKGQNILTNDFKMGAYSITIIDNMNSNDVLKLEEKIRKVDGVNEVVSLYDIVGTTIPIEMLPNEIVEKVHDGSSDLLFITFSESTSAEETLNAIEEIRRITSDNVKTGGLSSMVLDTMNLSNQEILIYIVIAVILCILVLELSLDSYIAPILLLANIGFAILLNLGTNIFLGQISYITKALAAVLQLGVTTDFSIFLYHSYEKKKSEYNNDERAMAEAIIETFTSVVGSSLTTIAGFLVLCTMQLTLGRDLGIVMAKGVLLGVVSVLTLYPSLILFFDKIVEKTRHKIFIPNFNKLNKFIIKHHIAIFVTFLILLVPAYLAYSKVDVYYKMDKTLPNTLESISTNKRLKENFKIVSPQIVLMDKNLKIDNVNTFIKELETVDGVDFVLSFSKLKSLGLTENMLDSDVVKIFENDKYQIILYNSLYDIASDELNNQVQVVNNIVKKYDSNAIVAGEGSLMKDLILISDKDFNNVNVSSIICIFIILFIVLRSLSLPFLLITAIEFAIFTNMSVSYFNGTVLPFVAPIVLGTIQLGATIDYAILMTTTYLEKRKNINKKEAMLETLNFCGSSIFVSGMCFFAATFGVGIYSDLKMVGFLCSLISRGAIISMLVVITILPSILLIFDKLIIKTTFNKRKDIKMKNKLQNYIKKIAVWTVLIGTILTCIPLNVLAIRKEETVYTKLNYDGSIKTVLVNEQLLDLSSNDTINDYTELNDILNLGNDSTYTKNSNSIDCQNNKNDIFYQDTTDKKLPIRVDITYKLNGEDIKIDELIGKSGKVNINLKYTNCNKHTVNINGKNKTLYTPFIVTMGTIIDNENNKNIEVTNGKIVNNGTKNVIVAIATPGLYESLNISELKNMDTISITYDTKKFELSSIYSYITPKLIDSSDLKIFDKLDNLYKKVNILQENMNEIDKGAKELSNGIDSLSSNYYKFNTGFSAVNNNINVLNSGMQELKYGVNNILNNEYLKEIRNYLPTLSKNIRLISNNDADYIQKINYYLDGSIEIVDGITINILDLINYLDNIQEYMNENNYFQNAVSEYITTTDSYINKIEDYANSINKVSDFTSNAANYIIELYEANPELAGEELTKLYNEAISMQNNIDFDQINSSIHNLKSNLNNANVDLQTIMKKYNLSVNDIIEKINNLKKACVNLDDIRNKIKEINTVIDKDIIEGKKILKDNIESLEKLPNQIDETSNKIDKFESGINEIASGTEKLTSGINTLNEYSNNIYEGINILKNGANNLSEGITTYNKEGISKISDLVNTNVKNKSKVIKELIKLSDKYQSFAGSSNEGNTKFILVVDSKKLPKEEVHIKEETKTTFWQKIKNLFS